jgi:hypothetical protein
MRFLFKIRALNTAIGKKTKQSASHVLALFARSSSHAGKIVFTLAIAVVRESTELALTSVGHL